MPWWMSSILANALIMLIEYLNRTGNYANFFEAAKYTGLPIILAQWCLWGAWSGAPSLMVAWGFFFGGNVLIRYCMTFYIGETPNLMVTVGTLVACAGVAMIKWGTH